MADPDALAGLTLGSAHGASTSVGHAPRTLARRGGQFVEAEILTRGRVGRDIYWRAAGAHVSICRKKQRSTGYADRENFSRSAASGAAELRSIHFSSDATGISVRLPIFVVRRS